MSQQVGQMFSMDLSEEKNDGEKLAAKFNEHYVFLCFKFVKNLTSEAWLKLIIC